MTTVRIDPIRFYRATNGPTGVTRQFMRQLSVKTADHLQRNAPRNPVGNELHRSRVPRYADSFRSQVYGNLNRTGFRMTNVSEHAIYVEKGRTGSTKNQYYSYVGEPGGARWHGGTPPRNPTNYMDKTMTRFVRRQTS